MPGCNCWAAARWRTPARLQINGEQWGIYASGGAGTVTNQGSLLGINGDGVYFAAGGTLTNTGSAAFVFGFQNGVYVSGGRGVIVNQGTIRGRYDYGVFLGAGGAVTNSAGAQILGEPTASTLPAAQAPSPTQAP